MTSPSSAAQLACCESHACEADCGGTGKSASQGPECPFFLGLPTALAVVEAELGPVAGPVAGAATAAVAAMMAVVTTGPKAPPTLA